jgi:hypothetical protein
MPRSARRSRRSEGQPCPYCRRPMVNPGRNPALRGHRPSLDHILPRSWGGADIAENYRTCCVECNENRAIAGHCPAALACARSVARSRGERTHRVLVRWRLTIPEPPRNPLESPAFSQRS